MKRDEKMQLLKRIAIGKASIADLEPPIEFFILYSDGPNPEVSVSEQRLNPNPTLTLTPDQFEKW